jgi:hypothetical protein
VETVGFRQVMWLVMLGSAKDRILGVDVQLAPAAMLHPIIKPWPFRAVGL